MFGFDVLLSDRALDKYLAGQGAIDKRIWTYVCPPGGVAVSTEDGVPLMEMGNGTKDTFLLVNDADIYEVGWGMIAYGRVSVYNERKPYDRLVVDAAGWKCYNDLPAEFRKRHIDPSVIGTYRDLAGMFLRLI